MASDEHANDEAPDLDDRTVTFSFEATRPVAEQVIAAAQLVGVHPAEFVETAVLNRLQAVDNVLHEDTHIGLPEDFDAEAWRERYDHIRRPEVPDGY